MLRHFVWSRGSVKWKPPDSLALSHYTAGTLWTPPARREKLDLHAEYKAALETAVRENQEKLAAHFGLKSEPTSRRTFRTIINHLQTEYYGPTHNEAERPQIAFSHCPTSLYNAFLRQLYASPPKFPKVLSAMAALPQPAARFINPVHLQDMLFLARQHNDTTAYLTVVEELERVGYKFLPFERAEILLLIAKARRPDLLEKFSAWRKDFTGGDLRILNVLLNAGIKGRCSDLQNFVTGEIKAHELKPDRLTYHCLMRLARDNPVALKATFREFCDRGLVIDSLTLNIMIQGLLHSGYISAAENFLNQLLRNSPDTYTVPSNPNKLTMLLWMIDRARELSENSSELTQMVSLVPDQNILVAFAGKYMELGDFAKLCDTLKSMADHGYFSRDLVYRISRSFRHQWTVQEYDVFVALVLDISTELPLMTEALAKNLNQTHQILRPANDSIYDLCLAS